MDRGAGGDFFISYTGVNVAWARWIAVELERAGYTTVVQAFDFRRVRISCTRCSGRQLRRRGRSRCCRQRMSGRGSPSQSGGLRSRPIRRVSVGCWCRCGSSRASRRGCWPPDPRRRPQRDQPARGQHQHDLARSHRATDEIGSEQNTANAIRLGSSVSPRCALRRGRPTSSRFTTWNMPPSVRVQPPRRAAPRVRKTSISRLALVISWQRAARTVEAVATNVRVTGTRPDARR